MQACDKINEMISASAINARLDELAIEIDAEFAGQNVIIICVLRGAMMFMSDMVRRLNFSMEIDFLQLKSYYSTSSSGEIELIKDVGDIAGKHVLVFEDIVDTGHTLQFILQHLAAKNPARLKTCALLNNPARRQIADVAPDYIGFVIPNKFVVGYGLDYNEKYRNLSYIATINGGK